MSYIYHGEPGWIKQPNRVVQTFRSGLCMIQQQYIRRADENIDYFSFREGDAISREDASPCIDGAYIFPTPSYQDMGNGFITCTVTAYGRVNTTGVIDLNKLAANYLSFEVDSSGEEKIEVSEKIYDLAVYRFTARKGEFVTAPVLPTLYIYDLSGVRLPVGQIRGFTGGNSFFTEEFRLGRKILSQESTNYGEFSEVIISAVASGDFKRITY